MNNIQNLEGLAVSSVVLEKPQIQVMIRLEELLSETIERQIVILTL